MINQARLDAIRTAAETFTGSGPVNAHALRDDVFAMLDEIDGLRAVVTELVACKDLREIAELMNGAQSNAAYKEYRRRKPGAWATARNSLKEAP